MAQALESRSPNRPFSLSFKMWPLFFIFIILIDPLQASSTLNHTTSTEDSITLHPDLLDEHQERIVSGIVSKADDHPYIVSIRLKKRGHHCGGTIINDDTILTAMHCIVSLQKRKRKATDLQVYAGHANITVIDSGYLFPVKKWITNDDFDKDDLLEGHDIALLKLARRINFATHSRAKRICLPRPNDEPRADKCLVLGWGYLKAKTKTVKELREVNVPVRKASECRRVSPDYNDEQLLCAGFRGGRGQADACKGDSGGPLICPSGSDPDVWLQYGIVSYGFGCGKSYGFYTKVSNYIDWIRTNAEDGGDGGDGGGRSRKKPKELSLDSFNFK